MKKTILSTLFIFFVYAIILGQRGYENNTNHYTGNYTIEPYYSIGENNHGFGGFLGFYPTDQLLVRLGGTYRDFKYKDYKESIIEPTIDVSYAFLTPSYDNRIFGNINLSGMLGFAYEAVKVKSETVLVDPYPKYYYGYLGAQLEYTISDKIGILGTFRQFYALNGGEHQDGKLGYYRYDYGISLRYYLYR